MTKQVLIDLCKAKIDYCTEKLNNPPIEYEFYNGFYKKYNYKSIKGLLEIPFPDFATALFCPDISKKMTEIIEDVKSFSKLPELFTPDELYDINETIMAFVLARKIDILEDIFSDTNKRRMIMKFKDSLDDENLTFKEKNVLNEGNRTIEKLIRENNPDNCNVLKLLEYYKMDSVTTSNVISITRAFKNIREGYEKNINYKSREFKEKYNTQGINTICESITSYRNFVNKEYAKVETILKTEIATYKRFLKDIENAFEKDEIRNYKMIIKDVEDDRVKLGFLKLVYQHNRMKYDEINAVYNELTKNSLIDYLNILKENNIKKDDVDLNKVMRNSCEDLSKMLKILSSIVNDKESIIKIIEISDYENVNYFKDLKSRNVLSNKAYTKYPEIFDVSSDYRRQLDENISIINKYKVDYTNFTKRPEVLVENTNLESNLEVLKEYDFINNLGGLNKYNFLMEDNLREKLDKIIELGYENLLIEDLSLLNENNWNRIFVLKSMGMLPETKEELIKYLRSDKFFINDDRLNLYIEDTSKYYNGLGISKDVNVKEFIKEKEISSRTLLIDEVIISKNRVLRKINDENIDANSLFKVLLEDSILSMDEVETIKSDLVEKTYRLS